MKLHLVVPPTFESPGQPSGGNVYDRELVRGLRSLGHQVHAHAVPGTWPTADDTSGTELAQVLGELPGGARVLVDGLVGLGAAEALEREQDRLRLWLLVHLPLALSAGDCPHVRALEQRALTAVAGVLTTSSWTRQWLFSAYDIGSARVRVAQPGVHPAGLTSGSPGGRNLLCVGALTPAKGHDVLVAALAELADLPWTCRLVGPLDRAPAFVDQLRQQVDERGLAGRIRFSGPLPPAAVHAAYDTSDLLVLPTRLETYGMVVTEALAHGLPVVASDVGGVAEALGSAPDGQVPGALPGALVAPGDPAALGAALRKWLEDVAHRRQLRASARVRRSQLEGWSLTARKVEAALLGLSLSLPDPNNVVRA